MAEALVGIIGGSGFYRMEGLTGVRELRLDTPFGAPSSEIVLGTLEGVPVAFLPRHGPGHRILPGELPSRASRPPPTGPKPPTRRSTSHRRST